MFYMLLLKQDTIKKEQVDRQALPKLEKNLGFEARDNKKYKIQVIINSVVCGQQVNN